jgi:predicted MPP superfamily phosphohydrolase
LKKFQSKYGTYGITGNHEYIGGIDRATKYIQDHGITLLRDEFLSVGGITLIGREDIVSARFGHTRAELSEIMK